MGIGAISRVPNIVVPTAVPIKEVKDDDDELLTLARELDITIIRNRGKTIPS